MITMQEAFPRAKEHAIQLLGEKECTLEELEQDYYKGRTVGRVMLGFPKRRETAPRFDQNALSSGVLVDTNLLVLLIVGSVNRDRIPRFRRTTGYVRRILICSLGFSSRFPSGLPCRMFSPKSAHSPI